MARLQSSLRRKPSGKIRGNVPLREQAFLQIRKRIICLDYAPGQILSEAKVSQKLGLGRTPVRQAFDRLDEDEHKLIFQKIQEGAANAARDHIASFRDNVMKSI